MNICLLSREYPQETGWGGIGTYTYELAHGLVKLGNEVHVVSLALDREMEYTDNGVYVHRIKERKLIPFIPFFKDVNNTIGYSFCVWNKLKAIIKKYNIEIVEAPEWGAEAFWYSMFKCTPLVIKLHTHYKLVLYLDNIPNNLNNKIMCFLEQLTLRNANKISSNSKSLAKEASKDYGLDLDEIEVIHLGIDTEFFHPRSSDLKEKLGLKNKKIVLFVGRLEHRKGVNILVKAALEVLRNFNDVRFIIRGNDTNTGPGGVSYKQFLLEMIPNACKSGFMFVSKQNKDLLRDYYNICDIFVAPSLYEAFGLVYLEAMACGKPVIGPNIGGVPEIIENGKNGILISPEVDSLVKEISILLSNEELCKKIGLNARAHIENNFTIEKMIEKNLEVYNKVLNGAK